MVEYECDRYRGNITQKDRSDIVNRLIRFFKVREIRLMNQDERTGSWRKLDEREIRKKVQQSLRDAKRPSEPRRKSPDPLFYKASADVETSKGAAEAAAGDGAGGEIELRATDYLLGNGGGKGRRAEVVIGPCRFLSRDGPHSSALVLPFSFCSNDLRSTPRSQDNRPSRKHQVPRQS
jgi:hypothetical protein